MFAFEKMARHALNAMCTSALTLALICPTDSAFSMEDPEKGNRRGKKRHASAMVKSVDNAASDTRGIFHVKPLNFESMQEVNQYMAGKFEEWELKKWPYPGSVSPETVPCYNLVCKYPNVVEAVVKSNDHKNWSGLHSPASLISDKKLTLEQKHWFLKALSAHTARGHEVVTGHFYIEAEHIRSEDLPKIIALISTYHPLLVDNRDFLEDGLLTMAWINALEKCSSATALEKFLSQFIEYTEAKMHNLASEAVEAIEDSWEDKDMDKSMGD